MRNSEVHLMITHNNFKQRKMFELVEVFLFEFTGRNNSTKQVKTIEEGGLQIVYIITKLTLIINI